MSDYDRGVHFQANGDLPTAILAFREALARDPDDVDARYNLAWCLAEAAHSASTEETAAQKRVEAKRAYRDVLERDADHARAQVNLAALLDAEGDPAGAFALLSKARDRNPELAVVRSALGAWHLRRASAATDESKRHEELLAARDDLQAGLALESDHPASWYLLGRVLEGVKDAEGARKAFLEVIQRVPDDQASLLRLARLAAAQGDPSEAFSRLRQLLYIDPAHPDALASLEALAARGGDLRARALAMMKLQVDRIRSMPHRLRLQERIERIEAAMERRGTGS